MTAIRKEGKLNEDIEKYPQKLQEAIAFWSSEGFKISKGI